MHAKCQTPTGGGGAGNVGGISNPDCCQAPAHRGDD
jgi:hypothetical protein